MSQSLRNPLLAELSRACNPSEPADKKYFITMNEARGSSLFADDVLQELQETNGKRKWLFSGHIGSGKSSELRKVERVISNPEMPDGGARYFPVFVDIKPYLDLLYITPEAVQLAIVAELADAFRGLGIKLSDKYFMKLFREILNVLRTPAESAEIEAGIAGFKAKFKYAFKSASGREKVQAMLRPQVADLLTALNDLFTSATDSLRDYSKKHSGIPYDDFVIIIDTLDRVLKVPDAEMGMESHKKLFVANSAQFTELDAFIILTIPLPLARAYSSLLADLYGVQPYVLPMVKVCTRENQGKYKPGFVALWAMLERRLDGRDPSELIDEKAFEHIAKNTGGYVREFVAAVGSAARKAQGQRITLSDAEIVIANIYATYENSIRPEWLPQLIALYRDPLYRPDILNRDILEMLENHTILEYQNGLSDSDRMRKNTIWYALHPLIRQSEYLEDAVKAQVAEEKPALPLLTSTDVASDAILVEDI